MTKFLQNERDAGRYHPILTEGLDWSFNAKFMNWMKFNQIQEADATWLCFREIVEVYTAYSSNFPQRWSLRTCTRSFRVILSLTHLWWPIAQRSMRCWSHIEKISNLIFAIMNMMMNLVGVVTGNGCCWVTRSLWWIQFSVYVFCSFPTCLKKKLPWKQRENTVSTPWKYIIGSEQPFLGVNDNSLKIINILFFHVSHFKSLEMPFNLH